MVSVIYIASTGRSGSTLLERVLSQHPQIWAGGELYLTWYRGFMRNEICSCMVPFNDCEYWQKIKASFLRRVAQKYDIRYINELIYSHIRYRFFYPKFRIKDEILKDLADIFYNLYESILEVSGRNYIIDSSKTPLLLPILAKHKKINLKVIHLIRECEAVAYSWEKRKIKIPGTNRFMPRYNFIKTALVWKLTHKLISKYSKDLNLKTYKLNYLDFVRKPKESLLNLLNHLDIPYDDTFLKIFISSNIVNLNSEYHIISGNPIRFQKKIIKITPDLDWIYKMPKWKKIILKIICKIPI